MLFSNNILFKDFTVICPGWVSLGYKTAIITELTFLFLPFEPQQQYTEKIFESTVQSV